MKAIAVSLVVVFVSIALALLGYGSYEVPTSLSFDEEKAFADFTAFAGFPPSDGPRRFAVGLNSCVDLKVDALEVFDALGESGVDVVARDHAEIKTLQDLQEVFLHFFQKGGAGERLVSDGETFKLIVNAARTVQDKDYHVGGNAAIMGLTIKDKEKYLNGQKLHVLMGGGVGPKLQDMLEGDMVFADGAFLDEDDYHVILEYKEGAEWGGAISPRFNRFIISHDETNAKMKTLEVFTSAVAKFQSDTVVLSGLHMMEMEPEESRSKRIDDFVEMLKTIPKSTPIHLELASMAQEGYVSEIVDKVFPFIDSIGLNEQELELVLKAKKGPHRSTLVGANSIVDTGKVGQSLYWLMNTFSNENSRFSRIHFHSLTFHIIVQQTDAWQNTKQAVAAGSWACTTKACQNDSLSLEDVTLRLPDSFPLSSNSPDVKLRLASAATGAVGWSRGSFEFYLAPVYVCKSPQSTVGLGDTISATGLFYSKFTPDKWHKAMKSDPRLGGWSKWKDPSPTAYEVLSEAMNIKIMSGCGSWSTVVKKSRSKIVSGALHEIEYICQSPDGDEETEIQRIKLWHKPDGSITLP